MTGESRKDPAKKGDEIRLRCTVLYPDGNVAEPGEEIAVRAGDGLFPPDFPIPWDGLLGCTEGQTMRFRVKDAFGRYDGDLVFSVRTARLPKGLRPDRGDGIGHGSALRIGDRVVVPTDTGELEASVLSVEDDRVVFDANHPLAGRELVFLLEILKITR